MTDLSAFPITRRWPAEHPDRLQLYSLNTPNGVKVSIMLEETGLPYEPHMIDIGKNETWTPEFLSLNPNGKIPAIVDPDGPGGKPFGLFESGATSRPGWSGVSPGRPFSAGLRSRSANCLPMRSMGRGTMRSMVEG
jgi:hypothetical protein